MFTRITVRLRVRRQLVISCAIDFLLETLGRRRYIELRASNVHNDNGKL